MKSQIRAPKARKVNSYMVKSSNGDFSSPFQQATITDFPKLEKRNSDNNIQSNLLNFDDEDLICLEIESEFREEVNKLSVISEIKQIFSQPTSSELRNSIERCENPFSKNFPNEIDNERNLNTSIDITTEKTTYFTPTKEENASNSPLSEADLKESDPAKSDIRVNTLFSTAEKSDYNKIVKGINDNIPDALNDFSQENDRKELKTNESTNNRNHSNNKDQELETSYLNLTKSQDKNKKTDAINITNNNEDDDMSIELFINSRNSSFLFTASPQDQQVKKGSSFVTNNYPKAKLYENLIQRKRLGAKASTLVRQPSKNGKRPFKKSLSRKASTKDSPRSENKMNNTILACIFSPSFYEYKVDAFPQNLIRRCVVTNHLKADNEVFNSYLQLAH